MKRILVILSLLCPLLACAQTLPTRDIPWVDISTWTDHQVIIAQGTEEFYHGHVSTILMDDNTTMYAVWTKGHGGAAAYLAKSTDAGLTWTLNDIPEVWKKPKTVSNCPTLFNLTDKNGKQRLFMFGQYGRSDKRDSNEVMSYSEDGGNTWSEVQVTHDYPSVMPFCTVIRLKNGDYIAQANSREVPGDMSSDMYVTQSRSTDGGFTWTPFENVGVLEGYKLCESALLRSPNGKVIASVMRDNTGKRNSFVMFSKNEGKSWSDPQDTPWGLTGHRHYIKYLPDGRLIAVFRDTARESPTKGSYVAWVGTWDDLVKGRPGQYRILLLHNNKEWDCGYGGLEILPDGTIVATTYIKNEVGRVDGDSDFINNTKSVYADKLGNSIVSVRFRIEETDSLAKLASAKVQDKPNIPTYDATGDVQKNILGPVATSNAHPSLAVAGKTIFAIWLDGDKVRMAESDDLGTTWSAKATPATWNGKLSEPYLYSLTDRSGGKTLLVSGKDPSTGKMVYAYSGNDGASWTDLQGISGERKFSPLMDIKLIQNGEYIGVRQYRGEIYSSRTKDGGRTWTVPSPIASNPDISFTGASLIHHWKSATHFMLLMSTDNWRYGRQMLSSDYCKSFGIQKNLPWGIDGSYFRSEILPDFRAVVLHQDGAPNSTTEGELVLWVGSVGDFVWVLTGQYRICLSHSKPVGFSDMKILSDGSVGVITEQDNSIAFLKVSVPEIDKLQRAAVKAKK